MSLSELSPRTSFFSASRHSSAYLWGGYYYDSDKRRTHPVDDLDILHYFHLASGTWNRLQLKGPHPPGLYTGACASIGNSIFFYGGWDEDNKKTGYLYELNLTTLTWQELSTLEDGSPMKKSGCCMIEYNGTLVLHGGDGADGRTNELHIFDIAARTWSSPQVTGDIPRPDLYFTFTRVSQNKVVRCGGLSDRAIYVLDLFTMHWTKVLQSGPDFDFPPTATCIDYDSDHAQLLIIGEYGQWLLDVATWEVKKMQDTDKLPGYKYLKRCDHSTTMLSSTSNSLELLIFGGSERGYTISATTLLILKKNEDEKWWRISEIIYGDKLKERSDSYQCYSTSQVNEDAVQVEQVGTKNENKENSHGSLTQEEADSMSTPSQTSQSSPSSSSSQDSSVPQADRYVEESLHEDASTSVKKEFTSDVTAAILKKQSIRRKIANILLQGLPGSGKTSLLDRLLNKPFRILCPSTGICNEIIVVEIGQFSTLKAVYTSDDSTWKVTDFDESIVSQLDSCKVFISQSTGDPSLPPQHHAASSHKMSKPVSDIEYHVKEVLKKHNIKNITDLQTKNSLYIRDTGGQIEFQESLSLLIFGPSIFVFVIKTDVDIYTKNTIQYRYPDEKTINEYQSSISTKDAFIQFLTSVSAIQTTEKGIFPEGGTSLHYKPIVFIVGTHIDKLGTEVRRSVLDNINKILHEIIMERLFSPLIHYANCILDQVLYEIDNTCSDDKHFQCLRSDINRYIQGRNEFFVKYPVSYLLFCLELQNIKKTVLSMDSVKELAAKFYIEEKDIGSLLNFLHFRVGIIQHYNVPGISDLIIKEPQVLFNKVTELILKTFLSSGPLSKDDHENFCKKGILEAFVFESLVTESDQITPDQFLAFLLHLRIAVEYTDKDGMKKYFIPSVLNHVQNFSSDTIETDIAPLAITFKLGHCPKGLLAMLISFLLSPEENPEENPELTFDLLEDRIYQNQISLRVNSSGDADEICLRSRLSHLEVSVELEDYSVSKTSKIGRVCRLTTPNDVCNKLRRTLDNCLRLSFRKLHYDSTKIGACFSLTCSKESCCQLHKIQKVKTTLFMRCNTHKCKMELPESGIFWFHEESSIPSICSIDASDKSTTESKSEISSIISSSVSDNSTIDSTDKSSSATVSSKETSNEICTMTIPSIPSNRSTGPTKVPEFSLKRLNLLKWTDKDGKSQILRLRDDISSKWRDVGVLLDLTLSRLDSMFIHRMGDVRQCCQDVLQQWITNGSSDYAASWEGLSKLLEDSELCSSAEFVKTFLSSFSV